MKCNLFFKIVIITAVVLGGVTTSPAAFIDELADNFTTGIGDFLFVSGNDEKSSPGKVFELLELQDNGSETGSEVIEMRMLFDILDAGGISSANILVFGFGLNEAEGVSTNLTLTITALDVTFNRPSDPAMSFSLGGDHIGLANYVQGGNSAEARIAVDLGFDFMQEYTSASTELFSISSTIGPPPSSSRPHDNGTSDGREVYFLSSAFTAGGGGATSVVPEPGTIFLLGGGFLGLALFGRRSKILL